MRISLLDRVKGENVLVVRIRRYNNMLNWGSKMGLSPKGLEELREMEKLLVITIFFFSHNVFVSLPVRFVWQYQAYPIFIKAIKRILKMNN